MRKPTAWILSVIGSIAAASAADPLSEESAETAENPLQQVLQSETDEAGVSAVSRFEDAYVTLAVTPRYPRRALKKKIDGEITLSFDIAQHGRAENIEIAAEEPRRVFGTEAVDAMKYWAFSPARLASCGTSVQRASITMRFVHDAEQPVQLLPLVVNDVPQLPRPTENTTLQAYRQQQSAVMNTTGSFDPRNNVPTHRVQPEYPIKALDRRKEGMVAVSFMIEADGSVSDVEVVDTIAGYLFQRPTLSAIRQWEFEPRIRNGRPVRSPGCHEFIFHVDEYERSGQLARQRENSNIRSFNPN